MKTAFILNPRVEVMQDAHTVGLAAFALVDSAERENDQHFSTVLTTEDCLNPMAVISTLLQYGVKFGDSESICVGLGDLSSEVASIVNACMKLGDGKYPDLESLEKMRNKHVLRHILAVDLPDITGQFLLAEEIADIETLLTKCPQGVVVKPINASGSRDVFTVHSVEQLRSLKNNLHFPLLAEERFIGKEYSVESLTINARHQNLAVTEKVLGGCSGLVEVGQIQPASLTDKEKQSLFEATNSILDIVGYSFGLSHLEFILHDGQPKLVEAHGRVGGDRIADLLSYSTGASAFERLFVALKDNAFIPVVDAKNISKIEFVDLSDWQHSDEEWIEKITAKPDVIKASILKPAGMRNEIWKSSDRHAFFISVSDNKGED